MSSRLGRTGRAFSWRQTIWWGLASLAACAPGASQAQSSVTLYGIIDTGIEYVTNVGAHQSSVVRMPSLTASIPSRWGLRGKEDLGGGLRGDVAVAPGEQADVDVAFGRVLQAAV